ncbi:MAG: DEAD/DEAH box helicase [Firmicutes bacterium]|nr:DEAD/DEAH box helicase [Bacillota bacterium]
MPHPALKDFHPLVAQWFTETFGTPPPPQAEGWPRIAAGENVLLLAPPGSGKTLAAFLKAIDRLYREMEQDAAVLKLGTAKNRGVKVLYVSPLKALNNDIYRNLELPLKGIREYSAKLGRELPEITRAVRSGDTPGSERQRMLRRPPQILITTPESLFLMLSSKAREILKTVRCLIVDEIHTLFTEKRGAYLALSLERLESLVAEAAGPDKRLQRIGLSATIRPLQEVAAFLGGYEQDPESGAWRPRPVSIVDTGQRKELDLRISLPVPNLRELPEKTIWPSIYQQVADLVRQHRSTLVFVNNRRLAERVTANLNKIAGQEIARTHHGSLAREIRLEVERKLKSGELKCVVATASLELGIDVGEIDLVIQLESPKEVARGLQRVGRAGHVINLPSKGRIIPKNRADLLEAAALLQEMKAGRVEQMKAPLNCLDILAQQLVAMTATGEEQVEKAWQIVRSAYNYHTLARTDFERVLAMLSGVYESKEYLDLRPRLYWDRSAGVIKPDAYGKRLVYTAGGTIPDRGYFGVYLAGSNVRLGELDEEFVYERRLNDRFVLGTSVWRIEEIRQDRVIVSPAGKGEAHVPFWRAEQGGRSYELGKRIGAFLGRLEAKLEAGELLPYLQTGCGFGPEVAKNLYNYLAAQKRAVGYLPTDRRIVLEEFPDEAGEWRLLIHSTFGNRVLLPLALLINAAWEESLGAKFPFITQDDGIMFSVPRGSTPPAIDWPGLAAGAIEEKLGKGLAGTPIFGAVFRHVAQRSLVMPRGGYGGKRVPLWLARIRADNLLQIVTRDRDFPLVVEAYREIFQDYLDLDGLYSVLAEVGTGKIQIYRKQHQTPSPFAHGHLFNFVANFMYDTDTPKVEGGERLFGLGAATLRTIAGRGGFRDLFRTDIIKEVDRKARGIDLVAKELSEERVRYWLTRCGDLTDLEIAEAFPQREGEVRAILSALQAKGLAVLVEVEPKAGPKLNPKTETGAHSGVDFEADHRTAAGGGGGRQLLVNRDELATYLMGLPGATVREGRAKEGEKAGGKGIDGMEANGRGALGAFPGSPPTYREAKARIIQRYVRTHGPFTARELAARYGWTLPEVEEELAALASVGLAEAGEFIPGGQGEEWCDPEILREIHRRSLVRGRQEVKARTRLREPREYAAFLARWQGVTGERSEMEGLAETLAQLSGCWFPAADWERHLLPVRVRGYKPSLLDRLFASGQFQWRARGTADHLQIRIESFRLPGDEEEQLFLSGATPLNPDTDGFQSTGEKSAGPEEAASPGREQTAETLPALSGLSASGRLILDLLMQKGAETLPFLLRETRLPTPTVWQALEELMLQGAITNDSFGPVRYLLRTKPQDRLGAYGVIQPAVMAQMGRWSVLPPIKPDREMLIRSLFHQYGVVCREIAQAEGISWGEVAPLFAVLENLGRVHRGYFIKGLSGVQYALPQALAVLNVSGEASERCWALAWSDPANPLLYITEWPEIPEARKPTGDYLVFADGRPILAAAGRNLRLQTLGPVPPSLVEEGLKALMTVLYPAYPDQKIIVHSFNGEPVSQTRAKEILAALGFEAGYQRMTLWPSDRKLG